MFFAFSFFGFLTKDSSRIVFFVFLVFSPKSLLGEVLDTPPNQKKTNKKTKKTIPGRSWTGGGGVSKESVRIVVFGFIFFGFIIFFRYSAFCQRTAVEMSLAIHLSRSLKKIPKCTSTSRACPSVKM